MKKQSAKKRVWELDALCGLLILCMIALHLYIYVDKFCVHKYNIDHYGWVNKTDPLHFWFDWGEDGVVTMNFLTGDIRSALMRMGQDTFFVLSGISCILSRNNTKKTKRFLIAAFSFTAFTFALSLISGDTGDFMRFGPLMCYAFCHLIFVLFFEKKNNRFLIISAIIVLTLGYVQRYLFQIYTKTILLLPLGYYPKDYLTGELMPIFPMLGWLLIGVFIGRQFYSKKESLFPNSKINKFTKPLQWFGKHSGAVYIGHLITLNVIFYGIGYIFDLF